MRTKAIVGAAVLVALACPSNLFSAPATPSHFGSKLPDKLITQFGQRHLADVDVIAEVEVIKVTRMGMAVDVVKVKPLRIILDHHTEQERRKLGLSVFSNRGDFLEGMRYLLLLSRFGSGHLYSTRQKLLPADKEYEAKVRMVGEYVSIELIRGSTRRARALKILLLANLGDRSFWIRNNALYELEGLLDSMHALFDREDVKKIDALNQKEYSQNFKKRLSRVKATIIEGLEDREKG